MSFYNLLQTRRASVISQVFYRRFYNNHHIYMIGTYRVGVFGGVQTLQGHLQVTMGVVCVLMFRAKLYTGTVVGLGQVKTRGVGSMFRGRVVYFIRKAHNKVFGQSGTGQDLTLVSHLGRVLGRSMVLCLQVFGGQFNNFVNVTTIFTNTHRGHSKDRDHLTFQDLCRPTRLPTTTSSFILRYAKDVRHYNGGHYRHITLLTTFFLRVIGCFTLTLFIRGERPSFGFVFNRLF